VIEVAVAIGIAVVIGVILIVRSGVVSAGSGSAANPLPADTSLSPLAGGHNDWDTTIRTALANAGFFGADVDRYALLVKAIIQQESGWAEQAKGDYSTQMCPQRYRGHAGTENFCSLGLGQIHRFYHPDLADVYDLMDGTQNIAAMANLLAQLRAVVGDDVERIAAAYNGGQAAGLAWPNVSVQVNRYVQAVAGRYQALSGGLVTGA
jgi:hypothetical protein